MYKSLRSKLAFVKVSIMRKIKSIIFSHDKNFFPIFVCGVAGSGNSLAAMLLDQNYETRAFANESALRAEDESPLKIRHSYTYESLEAFVEDMFVKESDTPEIVRECCLNYYRRKARLLSASDIVIDKAPNVHMVRAKSLRVAFPKSKFLLIFRDPVCNVEGLRRKWSIFRKCSLEEVCRFWQTLHEIFLKDSHNFGSDLIVISYEELVEDTDGVVDSIAKFFGIRARKRIKKYRDKDNNLGLGIRNVMGGKIGVVKNANYESTKRLSNQEIEYIREKLSPMYEKLKKYSERLR